MPRHPSPRRRELHPFDGLAALVALALPALVVGGGLVLVFLSAYRWLAEAVAGLQTGAGL